MYLNADPVVKGVLIGLAIASLVTWTAFLTKTAEILLARRRVRTSLNLVAGIGRPAEVLERFVGIEGEVRQFLDAAVRGLKAGSLEREGINERIASRLERLEAAYGRRIARGTGVLATQPLPSSGCSARCGAS
jgi:biopolymer transport protein ExbB